MLGLLEMLNENSKQLRTIILNIGSGETIGHKPLSKVKAACVRRMCVDVPSCAQWSNCDKDGFRRWLWYRLAVM